MKRLTREYVKNKKGYYTFLCDCGQTTILRGDSKAITCQQEGCTISPLRKHGKSHTRLYAIWSGMRDRCYNSHHSNKHYKDQSITICPEWDDFNIFERWALQNGYLNFLTIDRIKIEKNYSPDNCEWITRSENTRRQLKDRHPHSTKVELKTLTTKRQYDSITEAARYIDKFTTTKLRSIQTALENRIKHLNLKPYKGFVITVVEEDTYL